mmetsp:Transcript_85785/g.171332  ORF Transcript_85785/g.171332 Transcript_85785/m.171332 type:complete len:274 (-) Transcript_85785:170-991(-)
MLSAPVRPSASLTSSSAFSFIWLPTILSIAMCLNSVTKRLRCTRHSTEVPAPPPAALPPTMPTSGVLMPIAPPPPYAIASLARPSPLRFLFPLAAGGTIMASGSLRPSSIPKRLGSITSLCTMKRAFCSWLRAPCSCRLSSVSSGASAARSGFISLRVFSMRRSLDSRPHSISCCSSRCISRSSPSSPSRWRTINSMRGKSGRASISSMLASYWMIGGRRISSATGRFLTSFSAFAPKRTILCWASTSSESRSFIFVSTGAALGPGAGRQNTL